jgi:hypothetical protein
MVLLTVSHVFRVGLTNVRTKSSRSGLRSKGGNISEFAVSLLVFFLFALFPMINLVVFAAQCGTATMITRNAAGVAATSATYGDALAGMQSTQNSDLAGGFANFSKLTANGGYTGCGADLYIVSTGLSGGTSTTTGPNTALTTTPDATNFIYEYQVRGSYMLKPFVNMSAVPFIGNVPIIGAATPYTCNVERAVETPSGLNVQAASPTGP